MALPELEVAGRPQAAGPKSGRGGLASELLERLVAPFARGPSPRPEPATGFYTDTTVCIGCKACEVACKQWNQLPADDFRWTGNSYDNTETLSASSWRHVKFIEQFPGDEPPQRPQSGDPGPAQKEVTLSDLVGDAPGGRWLMMSDVCKHCVAAPCQHACPTGAIIYNEFANVYIQPDICNGCAYCIAACPFGVITRSTIDGLAHKCTLCFDRQRDGLVPACAKSCPTASIQFGPVEELREKARRRVAELHGRGVTGAYLYGADETESYSSLNSFYLLVDRPEIYGLPATPSNPWLTMFGDYARAAGTGLVTIAALLVALFLGMRDAMAIHVDHEPPKVRVGYLGIEVTKPPTWHGLVTMDLVVNNLTTGLFLAAAVSELARPALIGPVARLAYPIALLLLLVDLSCLVLDLGDPTRFHHMLRVFKPTSPMSLGTWSLTAYSLPLTLIVGLDLMGWLGWLPASSSGAGPMRNALLVLGLLPAFGSAMYKGVLFSTSSQPGWKDARWLGAYLVNSALTYGTGGLYALALASGHELAAGSIRPALAVLVVSNLVFLCLLAAELRTALIRSRSPGELFLLGALAAGVGVLAPLVLVLFSNGAVAAYAAFACLVTGGARWRHAVVMLPHQARQSSETNPS